MGKGRSYRAAKSEPYPNELLSTFIPTVSIVPIKITNIFSKN